MCALTKTRASKKYTEHNKKYMPVKRRQIETERGSYYNKEDV